MLRQDHHPKASIHSLPPEILSAVLRHHVLDDHLANDGLYGVTDVYASLRICRRWAEIIGPQRELLVQSHTLQNAIQALKAGVLDGKVIHRLGFDRHGASSDATYESYQVQDDPAWSHILSLCPNVTALEILGGDVRVTLEHVTGLEPPSVADKLEAAVAGLSQLRSLALGGRASFKRLQRLLQLCPDLDTLHVAFSAYQQPGILIHPRRPAPLPVPIPVPTLPAVRLRRLVFHGNAPSSHFLPYERVLLEALFHSVEGSLLSLELQDCPFGNGNDDTWLLQQLEPIAPRLERFTFSGRSRHNRASHVYAGGTFLDHTLVAMGPSIRYLRLRNSPFTSFSFLALSPQLQYLALDWDADCDELGESWFWEDLVGGLLSRQCPLHVEIDVEGHYKEAALREALKRVDVGSRADRLNLWLVWRGDDRRLLDKEKIFVTR